MPGIDRTQDQVIAARSLETTLQSFAQVQGQIYQKQLELLAAQVEAQKKKPSIIGGGLHIDSTFQYSLIPQANNPAGIFWLNNNATTGFVIPIGDADKVRIRFQAYTLQDQAAPQFFIAFALSPKEATSSVPIDQFSLIKSRLVVDYSPGLDADEYYLQANDEIPCGGNKYLHIFGSIFGNDLWTLLQLNYQGVLFSYSLIK
jgi:hypothetical protein